MNIKHLLVGFLYCGKCGEKMICQKRKRSNGTEYKKYICKTYHKLGREHCDQSNIDGEWLENVVIDNLRSEISDKIKSDKLFNYNEDYLLEELNKELQIIQEKLEKAEEYTVNLIKSKELFSESLFESTAKTLSKQHEDLLKDKEFTLFQIKNVNVGKNEAESEMFEWLSEDNPSEEERRSLIETFIDKVTAKGERVTISYKFK